MGTLPLAAPASSGRIAPKWKVLISVIFGIFMVILDTTVVNVAFQTLRAEYGATLNGQPFNRTYLSHEEITGGGEIVFDMASGQDYKWASAPESRAASAIQTLVGRAPAASR